MKEFAAFSRILDLIIYSLVGNMHIQQNEISDKPPNQLYSKI